jgi:hypothetical protein
MARAYEHNRVTTTWNAKETNSCPSVIGLGYRRMGSASFVDGLYGRGGKLIATQNR